MKINEKERFLSYIFELPMGNLKIQIKLKLSVLFLDTFIPTTGGDHKYKKNFPGYICSELQAVIVKMK